MPYGKNRHAVATAASTPPAPPAQYDRRSSGSSPLATSASGTGGQGHMTRSRRGSNVSSALDSSAVCLDLNDSDDDGGDVQQLSLSNKQQNDVLYVDLSLRRGSVLETSKGEFSGTGTTTTTVAVTPSWSTCLPIYAAYTMKNSVYVLILAFILPLAIKIGATIHRPGLLEGQLNASDTLSSVYLCYLGLVVLLTPTLGAVRDATIANGKHNQLLPVLVGVLCVGPAALLALLSSSSSSSASSLSMPPGGEHVAWTAVVVVMGCTIVSAELTSALLLADLTQLQGLGSSSGAIAMMNGKANLVGVGLAILVGTAALMASLALETGPVTAARYGCIATVLVNLTAALYVVLVQVCLASVVAVPPQAQQQRPRRGGDDQSNHSHQQRQQQQQQYQQQEQQRTSTMTTVFNTLRLTALFRVLVLSPPLFVHFLLLRMFYLAGLRCLAYLGSTYIIHNLELDVYIATKAVIIAFGAALLGMGMALAFLSAHEKKLQKLREASRFRRASSVSAATAVGAVIAAARVEQNTNMSPSAEFGSSSTAPDAPEKTPLLIALALLTVLLAVSPTGVANSSNPSSAASRDLGPLYIFASVCGLCFGFVSTYEKGILASMIWPRGAQQQQFYTTSHNPSLAAAGVGVGQVCGLFVAFSALLEWFPTLLFAAFTRYSAMSAMWAFVLFFCLTFFVCAVFVILEGVRERRGGERGGGGGGEGGMGSTDDLSVDRIPQLSMSWRISSSLLQSLPSHLSTIAESSYEGTKDGGERSSSTVSHSYLSDLSTAASEASSGRTVKA